MESGKMKIPTTSVFPRKNRGKNALGIDQIEPKGFTEKKNAIFLKKNFKVQFFPLSVQNAQKVLWGDLSGGRYEI